MHPSPPLPEGSSASRVLTPFAAEPAPVEPSKRGIALWVQRISLVIFVMFCIELGLLLVALPWTSMWSDNSLLLAYPNLKQFLSHGATRGAISGLGLIDIGLGIWEAASYHEK